MCVTGRLNSGAEGEAPAGYKFTNPAPKMRAILDWPRDGAPLRPYFGAGAKYWAGPQMQHDLTGRGARKNWLGICARSYRPRPNERATSQPVEVGLDEDGEPISFCIIVPIEGAAAGAKPVAGPKLTKAAKIALRALHNAIGEVGEVPVPCNHIPAGVKCVRIGQWRDYAYRQGISGSDEAAARRAAFSACKPSGASGDACTNACIWGIQTKGGKFLALANPRPAV